MNNINQEDFASAFKSGIASARKYTDKRASQHRVNFDFVRNQNQWTEAEKRVANARNIELVTINHCEQYVEDYLAHLFPRNPHTGVLSVGVKVLESDIQKRSESEKEILDVYNDYDIADILLEQGQNFLIGGNACLYYPRDPFGRASLISLDPTKCFLGWRGRQLDWFAFYNDSVEQYTFWNGSVFAIFDKNFGLLEVHDNISHIIPFSWIPNMPVPHSHEGLSKINSLAGLDRHYNNHVTNYAKRIEDNTEPPLAVFSDTVKLGDVERGRNKTTYLGKDDDMRYLELSEGGEILNYLSLINQKIQDKTGLVSPTGAIKSAVSGLSLSFQYSGMLDRISFFRVHWDRAFRELNRAILTYRFGSGSYNTNPVYNPALMFDTSSRTDDYIKMVDKQLITRRDAIDELRGLENSDEKLEEIIAEYKKFSALDNN